jgi:glycosyltransferase involved in cell wall biosynthesis
LTKGATIAKVGGMERERRRLSVLFSTVSYPPVASGGAETQARLQAEALVRRGHRVAVVCPRDAGARSGWQRGVFVRRLPYLRRWPLHKLSFALVLAPYLIARLGNFDLVHIHLINLHAEVVGLAAALRRKPVYITIASAGMRDGRERGDIARYRREARFSRHVALRRAAAVQALSQDMVPYVLRAGARPERVSVIPNGVDLERFRPADAELKLARRRELDLPREGPLVIRVSTFAPHKGGEELLAAWRALGPERGDANLILLGRRPGDAPVSEEGVLVRDWTQDVAPYLQASDIFVLPSYVEGMSNALLEAMACDLAPIATAVAAAPEVIDQGRTGILIEPRSAEQLRVALAGLLAAPARREEMGRLAGKTARERYGIEGVVDRIEALYQEVLRGGAGRDGNG